MIHVGVNSLYCQIIKMINISSLRCSYILIMTMSASLEPLSEHTIFLMVGRSNVEYIVNVPAIFVFR